MGAVKVGEKVTNEDLREAKKDYGEYVKVVVDVEMGEMTVGGEWHADGERILVELGGLQKNIWGGGMDLVTREIDFDALINVRPINNPSHVIIDLKIRKVFEKLVKERFGYE